MSELSIHDLETQTGEVLPEREALGIFGSFNSFNAHVTATNTAEAVQALTLASSNHATAVQNVLISG
jgi:hypothetical protein